MKADTGPWTVETWESSGTPEVVLMSDDFTHDVALKISGDFADIAQKTEYAEALAAHMNGLPLIETPPVQEDQGFNVGDTVQLKSGGPLMTVFNVTESPICSCLYFNVKSGEFVRTLFDVSLLMHSSLRKIRACN